MIMTLNSAAEQGITEPAIQMIMHGISGGPGCIVFLLGGFYTYKNYHTGDILWFQDCGRDEGLVVLTGTPEHFIGGNVH